MKPDWLNYIGFTLVLFGFWIAVSSSFDWPQLVVGLVTSVFVVFFNRTLLITARERPPVTLKNIAWLIGYFFVLIKEIFIANFQIAWLVLHPKMPIYPNLVPVKVAIESVASRTLFGNSITICPGTLTVLADEKDFLVHALTIENGEAVKDWHLISRLQEMEAGKY
ncbi:MAG: Na+/H+ antiporter subunit E [Bacillota bacterium]